MNVPVAPSSVAVVVAVFRVKRAVSSLVKLIYMIVISHRIIAYHQTWHH